MSGSVKRSEDELASLIAAGFSARAEMIPSSEREVERAERELLRLSSTKRPRLLRLRQAAGWLIAASLGALSVLLVQRFSERRASGPAISGEAKPSAALTPARSPKLRLSTEGAGCADCCAGSACTRAHTDACSSGRGCVGCTAQIATDNAFRLRIGALVLTALGSKRLSEAPPASGLETCVRAGSSAEHCVPSDLGGKPWLRMALLVSPAQLLAGFEVRVRNQGATQAIGDWSTPIAVNTEVLCRGIVARPHFETGELLATVSLYLDETHYVELARAASPAQIATTTANFDWGAMRPQIYDTNAATENHLALVLGPFDQAQAEHLRAQILLAGFRARLSLGEDFVGDALIP